MNANKLTEAHIESLRRQVRALERSSEAAHRQWLQAVAELAEDQQKFFAWRDQAESEKLRRKRAELDRCERIVQIFGFQTMMELEGPTPLQLSFGLEEVG